MYLESQSFIFADLVQELGDNHEHACHTNVPKVWTSNPPGLTTYIPMLTDKPALSV